MPLESLPVSSCCSNNNNITCRWSLFQSPAVAATTTTLPALEFFPPPAAAATTTTLPAAWSLLQSPADATTLPAPRVLSSLQVLHQKQQNYLSLESLAVSSCCNNPRFSSRSRTTSTWNSSWSAWESFHRKRLYTKGKTHQKSKKMEGKPQQQKVFS